MKQVFKQDHSHRDEMFTAAEVVDHAQSRAALWVEGDDTHARLGVLSDIVKELVGLLPEMQQRELAKRLGYTFAGYKRDE